MPELLFRLRNVPEDEADEIRKLLDDHNIDYYETHAGGWGISMPGIWLHDSSRLQEARSLIESYQQRRREDSRAAYEQLVAEGSQPTIFDNLARHPLRFVLLVVALLFVLYLSLSPFFGFGS